MEIFILKPLSRILLLYRSMIDGNLQRESDPAFYSAFESLFGDMVRKGPVLLESSCLGLCKAERQVLSSQA
jgi:hypothetical protein